MKISEQKYTHKLRLIAGRGKSQQMNWDVKKRPEEKVKKEYQELQKFIGKKLVLTGGGGFNVRKCVLDEVELVEYGLFGQPTIRVKLSKVNPTVVGVDTFNPWISSWQLSELVDVE